MTWMQQAPGTLPLGLASVVPHIETLSTRISIRAAADGWSTSSQECSSGSWNIGCSQTPVSSLRREN